MKNCKLSLSIAAVFSAAVSAYAFNTARVRDQEMQKPLLDHIVSPREPIDLGSDTEWTAANVATGTAWDDAKIRWEKTVVPARIWFGMWNKPPQPNEAYYRRTFTLTAEQAKRGAKLCCELAGPETDIILNGRPVGTSAFWALPFSFDVTGALKAGENVIQVRCYHGSNYAEGNGKNFPQTYGWLISMFGGISRPIHLELHDPVHIEDVRIDTKVDGGKRLEVEVEVGGNKESGIKNGELRLEASCENLKLEGKVENGKAVLKAAWPEAKLWTPDEPNLYYLDLKLTKGGKVVDALKQRFGFREISIRDGRLMLNGHPMINRRDSVGLDDWGGDCVNPSEKTMHERIRFYKNRGIISTRGAVAMSERELKVCDEEGFLYSPLLPTGGGYNRNAPYWSAVSNMVTQATHRFRNHPSLLNWCLFNEFGQFYGVTSWKEQYPKMCAIGDWQIRNDPAHFWTSCGDAELCPTNPAAPGPAPVRSLHYPVNMSWSGNFPEIAYWYENGKPSWQGVARKDKPLFISEDLYHGMNDAFQGMGRWGNDAVYTEKGYIQAWKDALLMCADGYYYGGVSEWNPWFLHSESKDNRLFDNGSEAMPTWLVSRRHGFPNVAAESDFEDELCVFNQSFTEREVTLGRVDTFNGAKRDERSETFRIAPGEKKSLRLAFKAPAVSGSGVGAYKVAFTLTAGKRELTARVFEFNIIPRITKKLPKSTVLLAAEDTPLAELFERRVRTAADAIAAKPKVIVCAGAIAPEEGRAVDAWVEKGGRAVRFAPTATSWSPVSVVDRRGHSYAYRRDAAFLPDVPDTLWRVWRPDSFLCHVALDKPYDRDLSVLVDSCDSKGFTNADIVRVVQGRGTWLITSLPVEKDYADEPAAKYLALRLVADEARAAEPKSAGYAFLDRKHPFIDVFRLANFLPATTMKNAAVVFADGSRELTEKEGATVIALAKAGKTVFVTDAKPGLNKAVYEKAGLGLVTAPPYTPGPGPARNPPLDEYRLDWFTRVTSENRGLLAGIPNTDFFFSGYTVCDYFAWKCNGSRVERTDRAPFANALIEGGTPLLYPAVLNEVKIGKGRLVVSTLPWGDLALKYPARIIRTWRTFLNNCGVLTATKTNPHRIIVCNVPNAKAHLWAAPDKKPNVDAWFGNGDDMRYFPVNLCGWSVEAGNKCPVQPFPAEPLNFGGIPFRLGVPKPEGGTVNINGGMVGAPSKGGDVLDRLWVLAALEDDTGLEKGDMVMDILPWDAEKGGWVQCEKGKGRACYGIHIGAYRKPMKLDEGRIGWEGHSEKTKDACLYVFSIENPAKDRTRKISQVLVRAITDTKKKLPKIAIVGLAWQVD